MNSSNLKISIFLALGFLVAFSSCRTYKEKKYVKNAYTELKESFPKAHVSMVQDSIKLIFPNNLVFDVGVYTVKPSFKNRLNRFAKIMNKYDKTNLLITGHTDNSGTEENNIKLSLERAGNVKDYLLNKEVETGRLFTWGLGEKKPITSNETKEGRSKNRRVEFVVLYKP